ncbi:MAG: PhnA protein [Chitinophagia bacterium]|nr:PhnA protein [Chitinophagia bacterium]
MKLEDILRQRSGAQCELCTANSGLQVMEVTPEQRNDENDHVLVCDRCAAQINKKEPLDAAHWQPCLGTSMWSEVPGVQVLTWRLLSRLRNESWAMELLEMMYLDDDNLAWAKATGDHESDGSVDLHRDCNGAQLMNGDTVVLVKSLDVKGSTLNARLGTVVRNIRLVPDNTEQIEGRIEGQLIVILTKYLRKQGAAQQS